jgi:tetratricopeptide (TPR) repeat protein
VPHLRLAGLYSQLGQYEHQLAEGQMAMRIAAANGGHSLPAFHHVLHAYIAMGRIAEAKAALQGPDAQGSSPYDRYLLAFLQHDDAAMRKEVESAVGTEQEGFLLMLQALTEQYQGHMQRARELVAQAVQSGRHLGSSLPAAYELEEAQNEAEAGNSSWARKHVPKIAAEKMIRITDFTAGYVLALAGDTKGAQQIADRLDRDFPFDTMAQRCWIPQIRAAIALDKNDAKSAINELRTAAPLDLSCQMFPVYLRGRAYLAAGQPQQAAVEFRKIVAHPGVVGNEIQGALALLQLGRAQAAMGDMAGSRTSYRSFLDLWKNADPDLPIYRQAKAEYAKLH